MSAISTSDIRGLEFSKLPWTRARATRRWKATFGTLAVVRFGLLALIPTFTAVAAQELTDELIPALFFPALFLGIVAFCERRFLRRPPKALLAAQLGFFCIGALVQAIGILGAPGVERVGNVILSGSTLLFAAWFVNVLLVPER